MNQPELPNPPAASAPVPPAVPNFSRPGELSAPVPAGWRRHPLRVALRGVMFGGALLLALADYFFRVWLTGRAGSVRARAEWMSRCARRWLWVLGVSVTSEGTPPAYGLLVTNHVGYLDILVLGAAWPMVFVAKSETRGWPVFGSLIRQAGTVFIRRDRIHDLRRVLGELPPPVEQLPVEEGVVVAFFPEGTSTDGSTVLPFRPALLAPAVRRGWPVTPAWLGFALDDGVAADEVCWWGETELTPHLLNLFSKKAIRAHVAYGPPEPPGDDRKELARRLHARVLGLAQGKPQGPIGA
jgi:1-acyl-sn-glycerol-3-phosphate acyltransferase